MDLKQLYEYSIKQLSDFQKKDVKIGRYIVSGSPNEWPWIKGHGSWVNLTFGAYIYIKPLSH